MAFVDFVVSFMAGRAGSIRGIVMPAREKREMYRNREMYREFPRFSIYLRVGAAEMYRLALKCIEECSRHAPHAVARRAGELSKRHDLQNVKRDDGGRHAERACYYAIGMNENCAFSWGRSGTARSGTE